MIQRKTTYVRLKNRIIYIRSGLLIGIKIHKLNSMAYIAVLGETFSRQLYKEINPSKETRSTDDQEVSEQYVSNQVILVEKGYSGSANVLRVIPSFKKTNG